MAFLVLGFCGLWCPVVVALVMAIRFLDPQASETAAAGVDRLECLVCGAHVFRTVPTVALRSVSPPS